MLSRSPCMVRHFPCVYLHAKIAVHAENMRTWQTTVILITRNTSRPLICTPCRSKDGAGSAIFGVYLCTFIKMTKYVIFIFRQFIFWMFCRFLICYFSLIVLAGFNNNMYKIYTILSSTSSIDEVFNYSVLHCFIYMVSYKYSTLLLMHSNAWHTENMSNPFVNT